MLYGFLIVVAAIIAYDAVLFFCGQSLYPHLGKVVGVAILCLVAGGAALGSMWAFGVHSEKLLAIPYVAMLVGAVLVFISIGIYRRERLKQSFGRR